MAVHDPCDVLVAAMDAINAMIASGTYNPLLDAVKGFRNGVVYGCRVRAPHALLMTLLWARGPIPQMADRIFKATKQHALNLGKFAFCYKIGLGVLAKLLGGRAQWHTMLMGFICGFVFWGDRSPVNVQVNMYIFSRIVSGLVHLYLESNSISQQQPTAFKVYAGLIWAIVMWLFYYHPQVLQVSLQSSMTYIYKDSDVYTNFRDLVVYNK